MHEAYTVTRYSTPSAVRVLDISAKFLMIVMLFATLLNPEIGNMADKGAEARAIGYPLASFAVPAIWLLFWRDRASFPWLADLFVTITCFTDILGNRMDLYDRIVWFDDWMHFMNTGLLTAAVVLLTLPRSASFGATLERALAFGVPAAVFWEFAEFFAFLSKSTERVSAYPDTLGDLALGSFGAVLAAVIIHSLWQSGRLQNTAPQLDSLLR
ncbi:hypothetical protein BJ980_001581 [Nocardioides daedukensis]|uniref:Uncharacterized protein n=1 Tax=Nocardioides daedukensis TaxID=634462 RepID=A0A7Y9S1Y0_9ACTN|nr:hypothetical protein [Nocardioides daedukensis]NYG58658.1 hypothetical protein [Nocardioides daedukensis]